MRLILRSPLPPGRGPSLRQPLLLVLLFLVVLGFPATTSTVYRGPARRRASGQATLAPFNAALPRTALARPAPALASPGLSCVAVRAIAQKPPPARVNTSVLSTVGTRVVSPVVVGKPSSSAARRRGIAIARN